jgi:NAD(P)-dependent dehydrogenase (short-subunit alcohol dehydrogenase family)
MSVKKLFDLSGRTAVVTGGSRGLGLQIAEALGEMGARVAITARKQDELDQAVAHLWASMRAPSSAISASASGFRRSSTPCSTSSRRSTFW